MAQHTNIYVIKKEGGGVALSALKELQCAFISDGGDGVEALTVDIHAKNVTLSLVSAYGPQESANVETTNAYWQYLHVEAEKTKSYGKEIGIHGWAISCYLVIFISRIKMEKCFNCF